MDFVCKMTKLEVVHLGLKLICTCIVVMNVI